MIRLDWNYERYRTRELLLNYEIQNTPLQPDSAQAVMVYPIETKKYVYVPMIPIYQ